MAIPLLSLIYLPTSEALLPASGVNYRCAKPDQNTGTEEYLHIICFIKNLLDSDHFRNVELQHVLDTVLQGDDAAGTGGAGALTPALLAFPS